jgi:dihydropteroate synthase
VTTSLLPGRPALRSPASDLGRCRVLAILNVTPDSFSDGGRYLDPEVAVGHALGLVRQGADIIDVGGESTRPGAARVDEGEELRRVIPVVRALAASGIAVSVDTMRARVAATALDAGAVLVNDVSGGLADPAMLGVIADSSAPCVLMHWRAHSTVMHRHARYADVVGEVSDELAARADAALAAGIAARNIVLDPGLGFAKTPEQTWSVLADLPRLNSLGFPLLIGASRKRFLAEVADSPALDGTLEGAQPGDRDEASDAVAAIAAAGGAWGVRVHAVPAAATAVRVAARLEAARFGLPVAGGR